MPKKVCGWCCEFSEIVAEYQQGADEPVLSVCRLCHNQPKCFYRAEIATKYNLEEFAKRFGWVDSREMFEESDLPAWILKRYQTFVPVGEERYILPPNAVRLWSRSLGLWYPKQADVFEGIPIFVGLEDNFFYMHEKFLYG